MPSELFDLTGRTAIVTGSTRGIGLAIVAALADAGARVVVSSRKTEACEAAASDLRARGLEAIAIACHVGRDDQLERLVQDTRAAFGAIDILVCNAAVNPHFGPLTTIDDGALAKAFETNVRSTLRLCGLVLPEMAERRDGAIVIVSSLAGMSAGRQLGGYALTKAANLQLARTLAAEWGRHNIRVNAIAPGLVQTDFAEALWTNREILQSVLQATPLRRIGTPQDIAGAAVFLAAPAARWITGQTIVVDGGLMSSAF
jgi:NAD(P)-dependent dehydrogenase (short-subunit alcohol dehydrogenase family)